MIWSAAKKNTEATATMTNTMMVVLASLFFLVSDQVLRWVVSLILGLGG